MVSSGAAANLSRFFIEQGIPAFPALTTGYVGSNFRILPGISGNTPLADVSLAFPAGFTGVLLSPVRLCRVLTREYFKADMLGICRRMLPACILIFLSAVAAYYILP